MSEVLPRENDKLQWYMYPLAFAGIVFFMLSYAVVGVYYWLTKADRRDRQRILNQCIEGASEK